MTPVEPPTSTGRRRSTLGLLRGDAALQKLLEALADVLLPHGMTPKRFGELARFAFLRAAIERSRLRNGRVNHSRVAAQTGLSRAEVKRMLLQDEALYDGRFAVAPVERVLDGWRTDPVWASRLGRPRLLRITGPRASFAALVRKYGGDVPHRALLDELRRINAVADDGSSVWLKTSRTLRKRNDFAFLSPVLPVLVDAIRLASRRASSRPSSSIYRLTFPLENEVDLAIVRARCASIAESMLDGLGDSLGTAITLPRRRGKPRCSFTVTVLLAENRTTTAQLRRDASH
jgi:hypothetical protein